MHRKTCLIQCDKFILTRSLACITITWRASLTYSRDNFTMPSPLGRCRIGFSGRRKITSRQAQLYEHNKTNKITCIDKQKSLKLDYIYNIENMDLGIEVSGVLLRLLEYFDARRCSRQTGSFYPLHINLLKYSDPKVISQRSWYIYSSIHPRKT